MPSSGLCETLQTQILSKKRLLAEFAVEIIWQARRISLSPQIRTGVIMTR